MIEFLNIQSVFEHYERLLGGNGPVETSAKYDDDRLYVEHYHADTGQFIIGAVFKRAPATIRIHSLACCRGHCDTGATQLTNKIRETLLSRFQRADLRKNTMRLAIDERCDCCVEIPNCTRAAYTYLLSQQTRRET
jgi:hypothetical protein